MTNRFSSVTTALAVVFALAEPAAAEPRQMMPTETVKATAAYNLVSRYGTDYQEYASEDCGSGLLNCIVMFTELTRNIRFTRVSCAATSSNVPVSLSVANVASTTATITGSVQLPVAPSTYAKELFGNKYVYYMNANEDINVVMRKGTKPYVNFFASGSNAFDVLTMRCTLTGTIL